MNFPNSFVWGVASAAYQIEGGATEDGRGPSIWDTFSHVPGKTFNGQTGDIAADAYHRYEEDLDLMQSLGIRNYRFSISWPRVLPDGTFDTAAMAAGVPHEQIPGVNPAGLLYYDRLIDSCLSRGITPWVTLYHWDLPLALYYRGGWLNRDTAARFADFSGLIARHFSGRVRNYITINEPQCAIGMGMGTGQHAPGLKLSHADLFRAWHIFLLGHGLAVRAIREAVPDALIGVSSTGALTYMQDPPSSVPLLPSGYPEKTPKELANAAFRTWKEYANSVPFFNHQWFFDPVFLGHYPDDPFHPWMRWSADVSAEDLSVISSPVDLAGLNIYNGHEMAPDADGTYQIRDKYPGYPRTALKWPVTPEVLYWGPRLIYERYGKPVCIMENGQSCNDRIFLDGRVHDPDRIDFLHRYLKELGRACMDGIPVAGYFHWSFTDNYEWHSGYDDRFGLVFVDYPSQKRVLKDSAYWYADVVKSGGGTL